MGMVRPDVRLSYRRTLPLAAREPKIVAQLDQPRPSKVAEDLNPTADRPKEDEQRRAK